MATHRRIPSTSYNPVAAADLDQPGWVAVPDVDDGMVQQVNSRAQLSWWLLVSLSLLVVLLFGEAPWWLVAVAAAEAYASLRRFVVDLSAVAPPQKDALETPSRVQRLRHFTSVRLAKGAPLEDVIARFLALDSLPSVRSVELGTNTSTEKTSRGHSLCFLVTFTGTAQRNSFLAAPEFVAFNSFLKTLAEEQFVVSFESGVTN